MTTSTSTRRSFLAKAGLSAVAAPMIVPSSVLGLNGKVAPSNQIVVGGVGLGPRGRQDLDCFLRQPDARFIAIADPQKERREIIKRLVDRKYGNEDCKLYRDMAEVYARKDIDVILICTGDRWHALGSILAAKAGKDVYSEKPCAMTIRECRELDETMLRYGRVYQAGTQRRNVDNFRLGIDLARAGKLGKIHTVHAGIIKPEDNSPWLPAQPEPGPDVVDWDMWLGPAPWRPFNMDYCRGRWRGHDGLAAGYKILEWGSHTVDLCQEAANADGTTPVEFESDGETIHGRYASGIKLVMRLAGFKNEGTWLPDLGSCPVRFEGDEGWVEIGDNGKIVASKPSLLEGAKYEEMPGTDPIKNVRDFLDCVKSRKKPRCNSTVARYGHIACFAASISWKLGRKLKFDPVTESFPGDAEANRLCSRARRAPWHA